MLFGCCVETERATIHIYKLLVIYSLRDSLYIDIDNEDEMLHSSNAISSLTHGVIGFCYIIDGTHIPIRQLPAGIPHQCFVNRKGEKVLIAKL